MDDFRQVLAVDIFHGNPAKRTVLAGRVDRDDVFVTHGKHRLHGPDKPLHIFLVARKLRPQDFYCDGAFLLRVVTEEDEAGQTFGQHFV